MTDAIKSEISSQINKYSTAKVCFSTLKYEDEFLVSNLTESYKKLEKTEILCVTGVANAKPLLEHLRNKYKVVKHLNFGDHYNYKANDIDRIIKKFNTIANTDKAIITTQKDWMRLKHSIPKQIFTRIPIYFQPVKCNLDSSSKKEIIDLVESYVRKN